MRVVLLLLVFTAASAAQCPLGLTPAEACFEGAPRCALYTDADGDQRCDNPGPQPVMNPEPETEPEPVEVTEPEVETEPEQEEPRIVPEPDTAPPESVVPEVIEGTEQPADSQAVAVEETVPDSGAGDPGPLLFRAVPLATPWSRLARPGPRVAPSSRIPMKTEDATTPCPVKNPTAPKP